MFYSHTAVVLAALAGVNAHSAFLSLEGLPGPKSVGFAVVPDLARNCTTPSPCQQDAIIIRQGEIASGAVSFCGRTEHNGPIDIKTETQKAIDSGNLAKVEGGLSVTMVVHQVNADGAGSYTCDVDQNGNGKFDPMTVTQDVPGANGLSQAKTEQFELKATMPDNLDCRGGPTNNICIIRCRNNAQAGPFGTCMAVTSAQAAGGNNGGNTGGNANKGGNNRAGNNNNNANNRVNNNNANNRVNNNRFNRKQ